MTESKTIDWFIKAAENRNENGNMLTRDEEAVFKAMVKTMELVKAKLKRIEYFGGIETLIAKASIQAQKEDLFADKTANFNNL